MPDSASDLTQSAGLSPQSASPKKKKGSPVGKVVFALVLVGIVGGGIAWGAHWFSVGRFEETTNNAYLQADQVVIAPKVGGYVDQVLVADNQTVVAGQPLVKIDQRQFQSALEQQQANVAARQADLESANADLMRQPLLVAQSKAQQDSTAAQASFAAGDSDRYNELAAGGADTVQRREQAKANAAEADANLRAQQAALGAADLQANAMKAKVDQARAALQSAQAQEASAEVDLQSAVITSAIGGRVADKGVRVGQFVQPGTKLMDVVPVSDTYLVANFKETQIGRMRVGQKVTVRVDAFKDTAISGTIESLAPGTGAQFAILPAQNATGNFTKIVQRVPVRIRIDPPKGLRGKLLPGMSSEVIVDTRN